MTEDWRSAGTEFYEEILDRFDSHPDWEFDDWRSRDEAVRESADAPSSTDRVELSFTHPETDFMLRAGVPDLARDPPLAFSGYLTQSRISVSYRGDNELVSALEDAQGAVAERAVPGSDSYVESVGDVDGLAIVQVPFDYDTERLDSAADTLSTVAEDVDSMYDEVFEVLDSYRSQ